MIQRSWRYPVMGFFVFFLGSVFLSPYVGGQLQPTGWAMFWATLFWLGGLALVILGSPRPKLLLRLHDPSDPTQRVKIGLLLLVSVVLAALAVQRNRPPAIRLLLTDFAPDRAMLYSVPTLAWEDSVAAVCSREAPLHPPRSALDLWTSLPEWNLALGSVVPQMTNARIQVSPAGRIGPFKASGSQTLVIVQTEDSSQAPSGVWEVPFDYRTSEEQSVAAVQFRRPCDGWYRRVGFRQN